MQERKLNIMKKLAAYILTAAVLSGLCACARRDPVAESGGVYLSIEAEDVYKIAWQTHNDSGAVSNNDGSPFARGENLALYFGGADRTTAGYNYEFTLIAYGKDKTELSRATFTSNQSDGGLAQLELSAAYSFVYAQADTTQTAKNPRKEHTAEPSAQTSAAQEEQKLPEKTATARIFVVSEVLEQEYLSNDGAVLTLELKCRLPDVRIDEFPKAEQKINQALQMMQEDFISGGKDSDGSAYGLKAYLARAQQEYDSRAQNAQGTLGFEPYMMQRSANVTRADGGVLSFAIDETVFMGGANGKIERKGVTFSAQTGDMIELGDLAQDARVLKELCRKYILALTKSEEYEDIDFSADYEKNVPFILADDRWYLSAGGLVFVALAGALSNREEALEFTVPYEELKGYIGESLLPVPGAFGHGDLSVMLEQSQGSSDFKVIASAGNQSESILLCAQGRISSLAVHRVTYSEHGGSSRADSLILYTSFLDSWEAVRITDSISDTYPDLLVSWQKDDGSVIKRLLSGSGQAGSASLIPDSGPQFLPAEITNNLPLEVDLDRDGREENISFIESATEEETYDLVVKSGESVYKTSAPALVEPSLWVMDIDGDGHTEFLLSGRYAPEGTITYCYRYNDGLHAVKFAGDARADAEGEAASYAHGRVVSVDEQRFVLASVTEMLGSHVGTRPYELTEQGVLKPVGGTLWQYGPSDLWLTTLLELPVRLTDGSYGTLPAGTKLMLTASDGVSEAWFITNENAAGSIDLVRTASGGWLIGGIDQGEYFEDLPYED